MKLPTIDGVPCLLPAHSDPELNVLTKHSHLDPDFVGGELKIVAAQGKTVVDQEFVRRKHVRLKVGGAVYLTLARHYAGRGLLPGGICPHKGIPVRIVPGGLLQCPAHGLCFSQDDKMVRQPTHLRTRLNRGADGYFDFIRMTVDEQVEYVDLMCGPRLVLARTALALSECKAGDALVLTWEVGEA